MKFRDIVFEREGRVAVLTINRPDKHNALNLSTRKEISQVLDLLRQDSGVGALVVTGAGEKSFISGSDLNEFGRMPPLEALEFCDTLGQRLYHRFEELDLPVIAMINGLCLGGGLEVALACDIRIASETAKFGQPEVHLGIMPGSGATQRLPRLVGQGMARELIFTGRIIKEKEALRIGLVNRVVPAAELRTVCLDMAREIASKSAFSLKMAKRALRMGQEVGVNAGLAFEALAETAVFCHPDKEEGVQAFFDKRAPKFNRDED